MTTLNHSQTTLSAKRQYCRKQPKLPKMPKKIFKNTFLTRKSFDICIPKEKTYENNEVEPDNAKTILHAYSMLTPW